MRIYAEDTEGVKVWKREHNIEEMAKDHERGALLFPTGIPESCKVEQPRALLRQDYDGVQGSGGYTNGLTRVRFYDGMNKGHYGRVFSGNCHSAFLAGLNSDKVNLFMGNFDSRVQSLRANRPRRLRSDKGGLHKKQL